MHKRVPCWCNKDGERMILPDCESTTERLNILYRDGTRDVYVVDYINIMENEINFRYDDYMMHIPFSSIKWYKTKVLR